MTILSRHLRLIAPSIAAAAMLTAPAYGAGDHGGGHGHGDRTGAPGDPAHVDREITVTMGDNTFSMPHMKARPGETIRFMLVNEGEVLHEFNIGDMHMHEEHQHEMMEMFESGELEVDKRLPMHGGMAHDDPNSILLEPGESGELIWRFPDHAEGLQFACNIPGHYQDGMVGDIDIGQ